MSQTGKDLFIEDYTSSSYNPKKIVGWYCIGHADFKYTTAFATYSKPNAIKRLFMRTLLDFYWIKEENK